MRPFGQIAEPRSTLSLPGARQYPTWKFGTHSRDDLRKVMAGLLLPVSPTTIYSDGRGLELGS
jgi:hypothetical protein